ncbi:MAG: YncE family protein [Gemmatimonadales bacterium]
MFRPRLLPATATLSIAATILAVVGGIATAQAVHYHVVKTIDIGPARADYIIIDPVGRRLYGLGDKVIDVDNDAIVGTVEGGGGGYAIDDEDNRGLVRNGTLFDLKTLAVTGHVDVKADGSRYDPVTRQAFAWVDKSGWVVDMRTGKLVSQATIGDGLESGVTDGRGKLFANIEDKGAMEVFDTRSLKIEQTYPVPGCGRAQGLSMDTETRRLFMACDTEMVVMNADNGNIVTRIKVPSRSDMNCFDPVTKIAFNPNRSDSTVTVVHEDSPDKFTVVEKPSTGGGARTCAVDEKTHKLYVFYYEGNPRQGGKLVAAVLAP